MTLPQNLEQIFGCDGIIIFKFEKFYKIGMFECKYPRIPSMNSYGWDRQTQHKTSHFDDQLNRQHKWKNSIAIWEMFVYDDFPNSVSKPFDKFGSTCIWHDDAFNHINQRNNMNWSTSDLTTLVSYLKYSTSIKDIIDSILSCARGKQLHECDNFIEIESEDNESYRIPLPKFTDENEMEIIEFLKTVGMYSYAYIDVTQDENNTSNNE